MGAGRGLPGRDRPERTESVYESDHTRVTRLFFPAHAVIRKQPLGPQADRRLRRETGILEQLRGVDGVAQLVDLRGSRTRPWSLTSGFRLPSRTR